MLDAASLPISMPVQRSSHPTPYRERTAPTAADAFAQGREDNAVLMVPVDATHGTVVDLLV